MSDYTPDEQRIVDRIAHDMAKILGRFVGEMQSTASHDATREAVRDRLLRYLEAQEVPGIMFGSEGDVDVDMSSNTPTTIEAGYLTFRWAPLTEAGREWLRKQRWTHEGTVTF